MYIKQISVFVENKLGRLVEITEVLADAGISIRAVSLADTSDFGILRIIVDQPDLAEQVLKDAGHTVAITNVLAVGMPDQPGSLSGIIRLLVEHRLNIEYMYAFTGDHNGTSYVIIKLDNLTCGVDVLKENGVIVLDKEDIYHM